MKKSLHDFLDFISAARRQKPENWNRELSADEINPYIREGFAINKEGIANDDQKPKPKYTLPF